MTLNPTVRTTFWNITISMFILRTCYITFNQSCVQRLISLPTLEKAKRSMYIFLIGFLLILLFNVGTGIIMYAFYHNCDPVQAKIVTKYDKLMPRFVQDVAGHIIGMPGIFISCVFSASLSTISAGLHAISGIIYNDYIRPLRLFPNTDANANRAMRITIFALGTFCGFSGILIERFKSVFQVINTVASMTTGTIFGVFTMGILYPWANQKGVLSAALISSVIVGVIIVNAQYHIAHKKLVYNVIPTSIEGCSNETISRMFELSYVFSFFLSE